MGTASKPILTQGQQAVVTNDIFTPVADHIAGTDISSATVIMPGDMGLELSADKVLIQTTAQNIRYTLDGTTPTPTVGFQLKSTDPPSKLSSDLKQGVLSSLSSRKPAARFFKFNLECNYG